MRVYAEVLPPTLGRAMYRINAAMRRNAPPDVRFVDTPGDADLQVLDVIGQGSLDYLRHERFVLLQHCYLTTETAEAAAWLPIFQRAELVMSPYDLHELTGAPDFPLLISPWGVDGGVFTPGRVGKRELMLTTGYDPSGEPIWECWRAARAAGLSVVHIGPDLGYGPGFESRMGISDGELAELYGRCRCVPGLRWGEGFELPTIEALACGTRRICFDLPCYRRWFDGHAEWVPEARGDELVRGLVALLGSEPAVVSAHERAGLLRRFDWGVIFEAFWGALGVGAGRR